MDMTAEAIIAIVGLLVAIPSTALAVRTWCRHRRARSPGRRYDPCEDQPESPSLVALNTGVDVQLIIHQTQALIDLHFGGRRLPPKDLKAGIASISQRLMVPSCTVLRLITRGTASRCSSGIWVQTSVLANVVQRRLFEHCPETPSLLHPS